MTARKEHFYAQLATLLDAGMPAKAAAEHLQKHTTGPLAPLAKGLQRGIEAGLPFAEALKQVGNGQADSLEVAVLQAAERGGKLEVGAKYLEEYYRLLAQVWRQWQTAMIYPLVVLHAALLLPAVMLVVDPKLSFWKTVGVPFCIVYLVAGVLYMVGKMLYAEAGRQEGIDQLLNVLPFVGAFRRNLALARFCQALEIQLQTGANVSESVKIAGQAAGTARLKHSAARMAKEIAAQGCPLGGLLLASPALPGTLAQSLNTAETVGRLDEECGAQARKLMEAAGQSAALCGVWIPKLLYAGIALFAIYKIFSFYTGSVEGMQGQMSELLGG